MIMDSLGWVEFDPALCRDKNRSWVLIPYTNLGQATAHPNEAMKSIKRMKLTGGGWGALIVVPSRMPSVGASPGTLSESLGG